MTLVLILILGNRSNPQSNQLNGVDETITIYIGLCLATKCFAGPNAIEPRLKRC